MHLKDLTNIELDYLEKVQTKYNIFRKCYVSFNLYPLYNIESIHITQHIVEPLMI